LNYMPLSNCVKVHFRIMSVGSLDMRLPIVSNGEYYIKVSCVSLARKA
jgi:hypothetical protein